MLVLVKPTVYWKLQQRRWLGARQAWPHVVDWVPTHISPHRDGRFGSKVGQIGPKWDKSGAFQIWFQCIWRPAPNALKSDLKKPRICPIWAQSDPLWSQTYHPWLKPTVIMRAERKPSQRPVSRPETVLAADLFLSTSKGCVDWRMHPHWRMNCVRPLICVWEHKWQMSGWS